jgi:hypothetical protein
MVREPSRATEPIDEIVTFDALDVFQIREPAEPCKSVVGVAVSVHVGAFGGGGGRCVTVTVVTQVTVPPLPEAVRV